MEDFYTFEDSNGNWHFALKEDVDSKDGTTLTYDYIPNGEFTEECFPCGVCRQVMMEFCNPKEFKVILAKNLDDYKEFTLEEILPLGFGPGNLLDEK